MGLLAKQGGALVIPASLAAGPSAAAGPKGAAHCFRRTAIAQEQLGRPSSFGEGFWPIGEAYASFNLVML